MTTYPVSSTKSANNFGETGTALDRQRFRRDARSPLTRHLQCFRDLRERQADRACGVDSCLLRFRNGAARMPATQRVGDKPKLLGDNTNDDVGGRRSEERRVGKECRL